MTSNKPTYTLTIRMRSKEVVENTKNWLKDIVDNIKEVNNAGEAQEYLLERFEKGFKEYQTSTVSKSAKYTLGLIGCEHLKYDSVEGYRCYEGYSKTKKDSNLGDDADDVVEKCNQCRIDQQYQIVKQYEKKLRMENQKEFMTNVLGLLQEIQLGKADVKFYHCYKENYPVSISVDQETIYCPKMGYQVSIKEHCKVNECNALNLFEIQAISEVRKEMKVSIDKIVEDIEVHTPLLPSPKEVVSEVIDDKI